MFDSFLDSDLFSYMLVAAAFVMMGLLYLNANKND